MEIKRKTEIRVETRRKFVVGLPASEEEFFCRRCDFSKPLISAEHAAQMLGVSRRVVYQIVETTEAHFAETETGILLVCPDSLAQILELNKREEKL